MVSDFDDWINNMKRKQDAEAERTNKLAKLAKMSPDDTVVVSFGDNSRQSRIVHKKIICDQSERINRACKGRLSPGESHTVDLRHTEITSVQFDIYLDWLYTRRQISLDRSVRMIADCQTTNLKGCASTEHADHRVFHILVDYWMVGDRLQDAEFQDAIVQLMFDVPHELRALATKCKALRGVMLKTPDQESKLRRVCLDMMEYRMRNSDVDDIELRDWTKDIIVLLTKSLASRMSRGETEVPPPAVEMYVDLGNRA